MLDLILASSSPRRSALLKQIKIPFRVVESSYREPCVKGEQEVENIALAKAANVSPSFPESIVLGADTEVFCEGKALGKPSDGQDARRMLQFLSGKTHKVITAVALVQGEKKEVAREETMVTMRKIHPGEIEAYVHSGEAMGKAGSYAIQEKGAVFVEKIEGCYFNVVGLPLVLLTKMLQDFSFSVWD